MTREDLAIMPVPTQRQLVRTDVFVEVTPYLVDAAGHHPRYACQPSRDSFYLAGPRLGPSFADFFVRMYMRATALLKGSE